MKENRRSREQRKKDKWNASRERTKKRLTLNPHTCKKNWQGLMRFIDDKSKNRPRYFADFIGSWENSGTVARQLASALTSGNLFEYGEDVMETLLHPYSAFGLLYFARLMDQMDYEEEERLRVVAADTAIAWHEFAAAVHCRHRDAINGVASLDGLLLTHQYAIHQIVLDIYFGDLAPEFRPDWARLLTQLKADIKTISDLNGMRTGLSRKRF